MLGLSRRKRQGFFIREIEAGDQQQMADIHTASFSQGWSDGAIAMMMKTPGMQGFAALRSGGTKPVLVAFLVYRVVENEAEVITIAARPKWRRRGAAKALMQAMIHQLYAERLEKIFLEVDESNHAALSLYRTLGFNQVGERKAYYETQAAAPQNLPSKAPTTISPPGNALIMRLDLNDEPAGAP